MPLVNPSDLAVYLQHSVKTDAAQVAIRVAEGWLRSAATSLTTWPPNPVPEDVWAWCLELAALAYGNPQSLITRTTDEETRNWALERRREILEAASVRYSASKIPLGVGNFPAAPAWPDAPGICPSAWGGCP
jgi:hypothetical protein